MASGLLSLKWNHHRSTFLHVLANIRQKESYCDVTLACAGKFYSAHKLVLSTCSEYFEEMFERTQCKHPVIVLKDIGADELEALLSYMYDGEVNVLQENLSSLIKAAECLKIKGLAVADSDPSEHPSNSTKDKNSSSNNSSNNINSKDVHRSHSSSGISSNHNSFPSDSSSRQFRNSSGGVKRPNLSSKQDDGPSKRRRPESASLAAASPARRHSLERPGSAQRAGTTDGKTEGDDGGSDGGEADDDGNNSMEGPPSAADDQPPDEGGQDDARSFAQGLSEQTGVKAEPVEIIDSDDMGGFDPQGGDGGSHEASDAEFTEEKFGGGAAEGNDPSMWGAGATNDMFSQPSTSSFTGQDGSNSNDNNSSGGKGGGSSVADVLHGHHHELNLHAYTNLHNIPPLASLHPRTQPIPFAAIGTDYDYPANLSMNQLGQPQFFRKFTASTAKSSPTPPTSNLSQRDAPPLVDQTPPPFSVASNGSETAKLYTTHTDDGGKLFFCTCCSYQTRVLTNMQNHLRVHTKEKPFACSLCSYRSNQHSNLKKHLRKHHRIDVQPKRQYCTAQNFMHEREPNP